MPDWWGLIGTGEGVLPLLLMLECIDVPAVPTVGATTLSTQHEVAVATVLLGDRMALCVPTISTVPSPGGPPSSPTVVVVVAIVGGGGPGGRGGFPRDDPAESLIVSKSFPSLAAVLVVAAFAAAALVVVVVVVVAVFSTAPLTLVVLFPTVFPFSPFFPACEGFSLKNSHPLRLVASWD